MQRGWFWCKTKCMTGWKRWLISASLVAVAVTQMSCSDDGGPTDAPSGGSPSSGGQGSGGQGSGGQNGTGALSSGGQTTTGGDTGAGGSDGGTGAGGLDGGTGGSEVANCTPRVECQPEPPESTGDPHQDCVNRINQFRTECWCLPPLERRTQAESCANQQAEYDVDNGYHAGAIDGICEPGGYAQNECPGYSSEAQVIGTCLQMMYDEGPPPVSPCEDECFQEYGHFINMTSENYSRVACGFYTTPEGDVWSVQNFFP